MSTQTGNVQVANPDVWSVSLSADGNIVAFSSPSPDLVPGDTNGVHDVFTKDLTTGATIRVSVSDNGAQGAQVSDLPIANADGSLILFSSFNPFWPSDTNGVADVWVASRL